MARSIAGTADRTTAPTLVTTSYHRKALQTRLHAGSRPNHAEKFRQWSRLYGACGGSPFWIPIGDAFVNPAERSRVGSLSSTRICRTSASPEPPAAEPLR